MDHTDLKGRHSAKPQRRYSVTLAPNPSTMERIVVHVVAATAPAAKRAAVAKHGGHPTFCVYLGKAYPAA